MTIVVACLVSFLAHGVALAQDLGWAEWAYQYDNAANWQWGGAYGYGRTYCFHKFNYSIKPQHLRVALWLYCGQELKASVDSGWASGLFNEVSRQVSGLGSQDVQWWFCAYHGCRPTLDLLDEWYTQYAVPDSDSKVGPTSTALDVEASSYYLQLLGDEATVTAEPTRICNVLSGGYGLPEVQRRALLRLYVDQLAPAYHKVGDMMPGFFRVEVRYGIVFPHGNGDWHVAMLDWTGEQWVIDSLIHSGNNLRELLPHLVLAPRK